VTLAQRRLEAIEKVYSSKRVQQMLLVQPKLSRLLDIASDPEPRANRWISYEALKRMAESLIGDHKYHEAFAWAIDLLLPDEQDDVVTTNEEEDDDEW